MFCANNEVFGCVTCRRLRRCHPTLLQKENLPICCCPRVVWCNCPYKKDGPCWTRRQSHFPFVMDLASEATTTATTPTTTTEGPHPWDWDAFMLLFDTVSRFLVAECSLEYLDRCRFKVVNQPDCPPKNRGTVYEKQVVMFWRADDMRQSHKRVRKTKVARDHEAILRSCFALYHMEMDQEWSCWTVHLSVPRNQWQANHEYRDRRPLPSSPEPSPEPSPPAPLPLKKRRRKQRGGRGRGGRRPS